MPPGYSGRDLDDVGFIAERHRGLYVVLPMTEVIVERGRDVQVRLAARGHHRAAGVIDLITAAVAEHYGAVVLHCDADFEHSGQAPAAMVIIHLAYLGLSAAGRWVSPPRPCW